MRKCENCEWWVPGYRNTMYPYEWQEPRTIHGQCRKNTPHASENGRHA